MALHFLASDGSRGPRLLTWRTLLIAALAATNTLSCSGNNSLDGGADRSIRPFRDADPSEWMDIPRADATMSIEQCPTGGTDGIQRELIAPRCATAQCHTSTTRAGGLDLESPELQTRLLNAPSENCAMQRYLVMGMPERSYLLTKVLETMPPCGPHVPAIMFSARDLGCLNEWVRNINRVVDAGADASRDATTMDTMPPMDVRPPMDVVTPMDTTPPMDVRPPMDTTPPMDTAPPMDTTPPMDTAPPRDTATPTDTAPPADTATAMDAATD